jgi:hypothetical protein
MEAQWNDLDAEHINRDPLHHRISLLCIAYFLESLLDILSVP